MKQRKGKQKEADPMNFPACTHAIVLPAVKISVFEFGEKARRRILRHVHDSKDTPLFHKTGHLELRFRYNLNSSR
jgi:hypothetical protein